MKELELSELAPRTRRSFVFLSAWNCFRNTSPGSTQGNGLDFNLHIQAERDGLNNSRELEAAHVLPHELVKLRHGAYVADVVDSYCDHLSKFWTLYMIQAAERDHREPTCRVCSRTGPQANPGQAQREDILQRAWNCLNKGTFSTSAAALWCTCYCVPQQHVGGEQLLLGAVGER